VYSTRELSDVIPTLELVERACALHNLWAVGWISYEASPAFDSALRVKEPTDFPKVWFATFEAPSISNELPHKEDSPPLVWTPSVTAPQYTQAIQEVREAIRAGSTYQVNYSFRLVADEAPDPGSLFSAMARNQGGDFGFLVEAGDYSIASASPELFFSKNGTSIVSRPMKGTSPRGLTLKEDHARAEELRSSAKSRAENIMIVDMTRNDLSRIARRGSVSVSAACAVERYPHMLQMVSEVKATSDASLVEILRALFPAASITGAPKAETMRIIAGHENTPRNIYTGTLGVIAPKDRAWFNVAIRTALIDHARQRTEYGIGSGIVWDSSTELEYEECLTKATAVTHRSTSFDLFETILWEPTTHFFLLPEHLERMRESAEYLSWRFPRDTLDATLEDIAKQLSSQTTPQRVRLFLSQRGEIRAEAAPLTPLPTPYRLSLASQPISSLEPSLYRKTTDRRVYEQAIPRSSEAHDVLLWNERGEITETKIANICLEIGGTLYTPPLESGLLNGCYRRHLLSRGAVVEKILTHDDLARASRIVLMNSLRRSWEAQLCETTLFDDRSAHDQHSLNIGFLGT
jgi:para-aminobenzoate synthetase/4-amino-4-deoxychorismate lyase